MRSNSQKDLINWASLRNIDVFIEQKQILSNINIDLSFGENIAILGPNGSGKSTFLKLFNRSIYPIVSSQSSLKLFNKENINIWEVRKKVGFLFKEMEQRVNNGVILYDLIASGFSSSFNSRCSNLISKVQKRKIDKIINEWELNNIVNMNFVDLSEGLLMKNPDVKKRGSFIRTKRYK